MSTSTQYTPRPGGKAHVTPENIIYGTDGKCRWVYRPARAGLLALLKGKAPCVLFTADEATITSRQVKGNADKDEVIHAFSVWVGGQSQPALRFKEPRTVRLSTVKRITPNPAKGRIRLSTGLGGFSICAEPAQFEFILNHLAQHCPQAKLAGQ